MSDNIKNVNSYDAKTFTRNKLNTRVVCREKPFVRSRMQRVVQWLKPTTKTSQTMLDSLELSKLMLCIIFPVFMLLYWKMTKKDLPEHWEKQFSGLQNHQWKEENVEASTTDYFSIINDFEKRREGALERKRQRDSM